MTGQPLPLGTRAENCVKELQLLKQTSEASRPTQSSQTTNFLTRILGSIDSSLESLQAWNTEFNTEHATARDEVVADVAQLFDSLDHAIAFTQRDLRSRLRYRRRYLIGFFTPWRSKLEGDVDYFLRNVYSTVQQLHAQNKILLESSDKQQALQTTKRDLLKGRTQSSNAILEIFSQMHTEDPQNVRSRALHWLWQFFPEIQVSFDVIGNADDPGDGHLYSEELVSEVREILRQLHKTWSGALDKSRCPAPAGLPCMAKICLVLTGMQRQHLLEDFLDSNIIDEHLPKEKDEIENILAGDNKKYAPTFYTEQRRAFARTWLEGHHLEIEEEEPLPLQVVSSRGGGSYSDVIMVQDYFTRAYYARKQQRTSADAHENAACRKHLEEERERLRNLRHKHIVQVVKTYQRGGIYAMILKPAATHDLEQLMIRYYQNKFDTSRHCRTREWCRPVLLRTFGCLSRGLAYIHRTIRHKDIKPANILYERALEGRDHRLLWADFGLAYDFSDSGNSKTRSPKLYSQRYAAPEIIDSVTKSVSPDRRAIVASDLDRIVHDCPDIVDEQIESDFKETEENGHGRMTDIFSLGCVFLEVLACILEEYLPMDRETCLRREMFSRHLPELTTWARERMESSNKADPELSPLLQLSIKMICRNPRDRPAVAEIVQTVASVGPKHFCKECWEEYTKDQRMDPESPQGLAATPSKKVNTASPKGSVAHFLTRVNSDGRPQMTRLASLPKMGQ
ncbi:MAG: hypothetical protein Q9183_002782, partial [Haloplaca sp. 2 TL-2023]